jgi:hypothetical protein
LYWWASVLVPDFHTIWHKWHVEATHHIQQMAVQQSLSIQSWKKNNLSDPELALIFRHICEQCNGLDNLKQHWAAVLMVWLTCTRSDSFTVSLGYQKGASLGMSMSHNA